MPLSEYNMASYPLKNNIIVRDKNFFFKMYLFFIIFYIIINNYPLESYVTHVSHGSLQGAPTESSENLTKGQISLRIRKDILEYIT